MSEAMMTSPAIAASLKRLESLRQQLVAEKDGAYHERNQVVAGLAALAVAMGWRAGIARTNIPGWDAKWNGVVYVDLPTGQCAWHFHDDEAELFAFLPPYKGEWDGHDTEEKYRRVKALPAWFNQKRS
jgi:hypothetical protein